MNIESDLSTYAYLWSLADPKEAFAYRRIPGREFGEELSMNNVGTAERPDWQYKIYRNGLEICCNRHFKTANDALVGAYQWLDVSSPMQPTLRRFNRSSRYEAITVDGLRSDVEVTIEEFGTADWRFRVVKNGIGWGKLNGPFSSPQDALAAYEGSLN